MDRARSPAIPEELRRYFWDYELEDLSWEEGRGSIVSRLLRAGGWDAARWLLEHLTIEELRDFLIEREGRGLDRKRLRFWGLLLELPSEEVDRWIAARESDPWSERTLR